MYMLHICKCYPLICLFADMFMFIILYVPYFVFQFEYTYNCKEYVTLTSPIL